MAVAHLVVLATKEVYFVSKRSWFREYVNEELSTVHYFHLMKTGEKADVKKLERTILLWGSDEDEEE